MSKKVRVEDISKVVTEYLNEYEEFIEDEVKEVSSDIARQAKADLHSTNAHGDSVPWNSTKEPRTLS